ncbi:2,4-dihydroxyhept-2-enedioate aldolase [Leifsonia sp. 98AMF]|uniref:HpcH/HpaI aldolase family protein n=1 Tax=unclassified Leifsonia TaxID=2663824 RepID=UPI0008798A65|nr:MULTISPECIES: aldolase/citrate lyase family protein [unclassified Leifsonia]SDH29124.1 2,4-dihydroxyhept-2-enedioate aldolase [Leifsonia sp. 197AMF]SDJ08703.1 2,4-dihydroxyhept-2-enedioate aldolase [Leifsonia sp. 466MF]SDJ62254.1 2,4-dihydroxyhept-2-enedioate aldolase [Leifsonia sp. 157MF]SDN29790.1 2,4-dihydroxyhept-2-enedioate aldolase [Leifsonia sp. 509MF]SEM91337.1 2,4-dihydroxyhept-2-enedioate aldolase [Leifsonia sp. 467MF]
MPIRLDAAPTFADRLRDADRTLFGMWSCAGSPLVAEICAGSRLDIVLIDGEHSPVNLESILAQLQAVAPYPAIPVVRAPIGDPVVIKQLLDLGAQNILVPMVDSVAHAEAMVRAVRYPPHGVRGVGSALARSSRWSRIPNYLARASDLVSLTVQIETTEGLEQAAAIAAIDGMDALLVGPADLAASMGLLGQQNHPDVVAAVESVIAAGRAAGTPVGVNAFDPATADRYAAAGAAYVLVGADVTLLAQASEALADRFIGATPDSPAPAAY